MSTLITAPIEFPQYGIKDAMREASLKAMGLTEEEMGAARFECWYHRSNQEFRSILRTSKGTEFYLCVKVS